jgi:hypothetical protein
MTAVSSPGRRPPAGPVLKHLDVALLGFVGVPGGRQVVVAVLLGPLAVMRRLGHQVQQPASGADGIVGPNMPRCPSHAAGLGRMKVRASSACSVTSLGMLSRMSTP